MAKNGLDKWFKQKWVDIGSKRKDGSFAKCGRSKQKKDAKRKYPKCVPLAKATRMSDSQRVSAVKRKRAVAQGEGGKVDVAARFEARRNRSFVYVQSPNSGLIELDEAPPLSHDDSAVKAALTISAMMDAKPLPFLQAMR